MNACHVLIRTLLLLSSSMMLGTSVWAQEAARYNEGEFAARERAVKEGTRRFAPQPVDKLTKEEEAAITDYKAARGNRPPTAGLFNDLLRVPDMMKATFIMRSYVQNKISFGDKLSELGMLVVLREWNQSQEFGGHASIARRAGLKPEIIKAIAEGYYPPGMDDDESLIYNFLNELMRYHNVSDPTYQHMVQRFGERGVVDGITLAGLYSIVGMTYNTVREPTPRGYVPMPSFPQQKSIPLSEYAESKPADPASRPAEPAPGAVPVFQTPQPRPAAPPPGK